MRKIPTFLSTVAVVTVLGLPFAATADDRDFDDDDRGRARLECESEGVGDIMMDARFRSRAGRARFDSSFEAPPRSGFEAGDVLDVLVAGVFVGRMELARTRGGDIEGDLKFHRGARRNDTGLPFPVDFPKIWEGTSVVVGPLGCALEDD